MADRSMIIARLQQTLDKERFEHSLRAEIVALSLAKKWRVSDSLASTAALLHDCARRWDRPQLLRQAKRMGIAVDPVSRLEPKLLHAELGARLAKKEFGIGSAAVLNAIRRHTIGCEGMSKLDKIIYLADHIEEGRDFGGVKRVRRLAFRDLDKAIVASASNTIAYLLEKGLPIHAGTVATRNYYLK